MAKFVPVIVLPEPVRPPALQLVDEYEPYLVEKPASRPTAVVVHDLTHDPKSIPTSTTTTCTPITANTTGTTDAGPGST